MVDPLRLLDLALSYALDNPGIHFNDRERLNALREMHTKVLQACLTGEAQVTLGDQNVGFRGPAYDEPI